MSARKSGNPSSAATGPDATASWGALFEGDHALAAAAVFLGTLCPAFGYFVTATVLPSVVGEIGGLAFYAWASTAYSVASILGTAGSSVLGRRAGTRGALQIGIVVLVAGMIACALAPSMALLVGGRAVWGLGAGLMIAGVHGLVREAFHDALWPRMLATISGAWGVAALLGPAIGGVFAGLGVWRGAFWAMVPLAGLVFVLTLRVLPARASVEGPVPRLPLGRLALICAAVLFVGSVANVSSITARGMLAAGAVCATALVLRLDAAARDRLFPAGMLSLRRPVGKGFWMIFFMSMSTTPGTVYVPLLLQVLHGSSPAVAGYVQAGQSLAWTAIAILGARLSGGGARTALVVGPLLTAAGFVGMSATIVVGPVPAIAASLLLVGSGIGTCWAHVGSIVLGSARPGEGAKAAALIPTTQTFSVSLAAAVSGIIANAAGLSSGATQAAAALAGVWLFGAFLLAPLAALAIATGLAAPRRRRQSLP